jgi:hypothetical protein
VQEGAEQKEQGAGRNKMQEGKDEGRCINKEKASTRCMEEQEAGRNKERARTRRRQGQEEGRNKAKAGTRRMQEQGAGRNKVKAGAR